jgi:hypothetical protein
MTKKDKKTIRRGRQDAFDLFCATFIANQMPQSINVKTGGCCYEHPTIPNHGCGIGILPGFKDLRRKAGRPGGSFDPWPAECDGDGDGINSILAKEEINGCGQTRPIFDWLDGLNLIGRLDDDPHSQVAPDEGIFLEALQELHDSEVNWGDADRFKAINAIRFAQEWSLEYESGRGDKNTRRVNGCAE